MSEGNRYFNPDHPVGKALLEWWRELDNDRGTRAALRGAQTALDVAMEPGFQRIRRRLLDRKLREDRREDDRLPVVIGLLAHLREDHADDFPKRAGEGDRPAVHPLRYRRIVEAQNVNELFPVMRRALPLVERRVNVLQLAGAVFFWGDTVRRNWIYDYNGWSSKG